MKGRFVSIKAKFLLTYISLIAVVIVILNTYPVIISRDLVFISKENTIGSQTVQISTSLEALDRISPDTVSRVMSMLELRGLSSVVILNADHDELYRVGRNAEGYDENISYELLELAMEGRDEFRALFSDGAFKSYAIAPIMTDDMLNGYVCVYEYDEAEGSIIIGLQRDLMQISCGISILAVILSFIYSGTFTRRITNILDAIESVREGEYSYRINVRGHDELAKLSAEFNSLTDRLQSTEEIRRRFVADASHELKTPLAAIRLLSDSILESDNIDIETVKDFVSDIRDESERLGRTTAQLLDLTKLDNNIVTVRSSVDCSKVTERVIRALKPIAGEKNVSIISDLQDDCCILATEDELYQIVFNLIENAIKYNVDGGRVTTEVKKDNEHITIAISDTGAGIPAQDLPYIFDRFYRVDKSRGREGGGSGLGLSIVKSTAEKHGGEVEAVRLDDGGMCFTVTFPILLFTNQGTK